MGLEAEPVQVEVDVIRGYPHFALVGLPDAPVRESQDRAHAALKNSDAQPFAASVLNDVIAGEVRKSTANVI